MEQQRLSRPPDLVPVRLHRTQIMASCRSLSLQPESRVGRMMDNQLGRISHAMPRGCARCPSRDPRQSAAPETAADA